MCSFLRGHTGVTLINAQDDQGYTPWALAVRSGHATALQALLPDDLSSSLTAKHMFDAASSGSVECLETLFDACSQGARVVSNSAEEGYGVGQENTGKEVKGVEQIRSLLDEEREIGAVLHGATFSRSLNMVNRVLEAGAKVDPVDADGVTPLMVASGLGVKEIVERLIAAGASVEKLTKHNSTCFHAAAVVGADDVLRVLLNASTSMLGVKDSQGKQTDNSLWGSPGIQCTRLGHLPIVLAALHDHQSAVDLLFQPTKDSGVETEGNADNVGAMKLDFSSADELSKSVHAGRAEIIARLEEDGKKISTICEALKSAGNEQFKAKEFAKVSVCCLVTSRCLSE